MNKISKSIAVLCLGAFGATSLAACGQEDPKVAMSKAMDKSSDSKEMSVTLKVDSDPANLVTIARQMSSDSGETLSKEDTENMAKIAKAVSESSLSIQMRAKDGKKLNDYNLSLDDADTGLFLQMGDERVASLLVANSNLFARVNTEKLGEKTGLYTKSELADLKAEVKGVDWYVAMLENKWIGLNEKDSKDFTNSLKEGAKEGNKSTLTPEQSDKLQKAIKENFKKNSTFKNESGDNILVKTDVKKAANQFVSDYKSIVPGKITASDEKEVNDALAKLKDGVMFESTWQVKDESFKKVTFDSMQFFRMVDESKLKDAKEKETVQKYAKYNLKLVMEMSDKAADLNAPKDFTKVNFSDLVPDTNS